jgi:NAD-dependent SIR2 family protein deacetylase
MPERHPNILGRQNGIRNSKCGCFHCLAIFPGTEISEWIDEGGTPLCPKCGIDSVLSEYERYDISEAKLKRRQQASFSKE